MHMHTPLHSELRPHLVERVHDLQAHDTLRHVPAQVSNPFRYKDSWAWEFLLIRAYEEFPPKNGSVEAKREAMCGTSHI